VTTGGKHGDGRTAVPRHQPARIVDGHPQGGYTNAFEITCPTAAMIPDGAPARGRRLAERR
jgi:hypothetical protein